MKKLLLLMMLIFLMMSGCGNEKSGQGEQMSDDFNIRFVWAIGAENIYDTYTGTLQKDLVLDGVATTEFEVDMSVKEQIWQKLMELDIVSIDREMTSEVLTTTDMMIEITPLTVYEINITANGMDYFIKGDCTAASYHDDEDAEHFIEFVDYMCRIARDTPEFQNLPEANGGYD